MTYAVSDEFGNQITSGLDSYEAATQAAKRYLAAHKDAPCAEIYAEQCNPETEDGEPWELTRAELGL